MLSTDELLRRPSRPPDYAAENQALVALAQQMATSPEGILQRLADTALGLCRAHSAGLSLLEDGDQKSNFHWRAIAGQWTPHLNRGTPRNFGPCGTVLDQDVAMVCSHPELDFPYWASITPVLEEGLLIPFYIKGEAIGTIWIIAHDTSRRFDAEDLRVMTRLGTFASAAYQAVLFLNTTQRSAAIVESSDDAIMAEDLNGIITTWNEGAQRLFGYSVEEVVGKPATILVPPDRHDEEINIRERIRRSERVEHYETVRQHKDGSCVDISLTVSSLKNVEGKIVGASKIARDITVRKCSEERSRETEARLQMAAELVGLGWSYWKPGSIDVEWDDRLRAIWGLSPGAMVDADKAIAAIHPDDRNQMEQIGASLADPANNSYTAEYRVIGIEDGIERWIRTQGRTYERGTPKAFIAAVQDITEQKGTEHRLRESEARLQAAVDLLKLGRYAWNPQTNELQWDETLKAMWGLPAGAPVHYDAWRACIHPDDLAGVEAEIQRCTDPRGDGVYDIEYRVIRKTDGVESWVATRGKTNFENGVPVSFYGIALDVTDRKRVENILQRRVASRTRELEETNRHLRSQIEQREIAEAEVQQLQRLDAIGQITSGVAHDFNNLLSVVLTNARLLGRNLREPGDLEGIELIRTAAERGANLTSQLVAFSRKQRLQPREVDLNSKIAGMSNLLSATLGGTVNLRTTLAADLWPALVDPIQIESVILNLVINARDAMRSDGTLTLETFNVVIDERFVRPEPPLPGQYVGLAVRDTGVGIPDKVLPRVFEPFFTTKEPGKGSGLGLAQVIGFAKQSGGGVGIETLVGEGTSVKVFLPRAGVILREANGNAMSSAVRSQK
jgi:PAS domain S-box-containing protein